MVGEAVLVKAIEDGTSVTVTVAESWAVTLIPLEEPLAVMVSTSLLPGAPETVAAKLH